MRQCFFDAAGCCFQEINGVYAGSITSVEKHKQLLVNQIFRYFYGYFIVGMARVYLEKDAAIEYFNTTGNIF